jgi:hypothetical protein
MSMQVVLPTDCLMQIFSFLGYDALAKRVSLVCRQWREISNSDCLWKQLCVKDFSLAIKFNDYGSWKDLYHMLKDHENECTRVMGRRVGRIYLEMLENREPNVVSAAASGIKC